MKLADLTPYQKDVYAGKICPYCKSKTKVVTEEFIYKRTYKNKAMICCVNYPQCDAYVGTHKDSGEALGRLAKHDLRIAKKETHDSFDRLWQLNYMTRKNAYDELADYLGLDRELTHIGFMNKKTLALVKRWAIEKYVAFHEREGKNPKNYSQ